MIDSLGSDEPVPFTIDDVAVRLQRAAGAAAAEGLDGLLVVA